MEQANTWVHARVSGLAVALAVALLGAAGSSVRADGGEAAAAAEAKGEVGAV